MNGTGMQGCEMDECESIEWTIDLDISKQGDGIREQGESSGSGVVGAKSDSKAQLTGNG